MAVVGSTSLTLADWITRLDPDGSLARLVEMADQKNTIVEDVPFVQANGVTSHTYTMRVGLPTIGWRTLNRGVAASKSNTKQARADIGLMSGLSKVDTKEAELTGNAAQFRAQEDAAFLESMKQEFSKTLLYGDSTVNPEKFTGLAPHFNSLSGETKGQIIDAGGIGADNTSIWLVHHDPRRCFGIFPKNTVAGFRLTDLGTQLVEDKDGKEYTAYVTKFEWDVGYAVADYRQIVRICNIDVSDLKPDYSTGADLADLMLQAKDAIFAREAGMPVFYMTRKTLTYLRRQLVNRQSNWLEMVEAGKGGLASEAFLGIPIRIVDSITETEAKVS